MADALHFRCSTNIRAEKLSCLVDLITQSSLASLSPTEVMGDNVCRLPVVVIVNTRDSLDACTSAITNALPNALVAQLHADLSMEDRHLILEGYRFAKNFNLPDAETVEIVGSKKDNDGSDGAGLVVLLVTDACLPFVANGEAPLGAALVIQMDVPMLNLSNSSSDARATYSCRARAAIGDGHKPRPFVSIVASDEVESFDVVTNGIKVEEMPFDFQTIVVGGWWSHKSKVGT